MAVIPQARNTGMQPPPLFVQSFSAVAVLLEPVDLPGPGDGLVQPSQACQRGAQGLRILYHCAVGTNGQVRYPEVNVDGGTVLDSGKRLAGLDGKAGEPASGRLAFDTDGVGAIVGAESLLVSAPLEAGEADAAAGDAVPALVSGIVLGPGGLTKVDNRVLGCVLSQNASPGGDEPLDRVPPGAEGPFGEPFAEFQGCLELSESSVIGERCVACMLQEEGFLVGSWPEANPVGLEHVPSVAGWLPRAQRPRVIKTRTGLAVAGDWSASYEIGIDFCDQLGTPSGPL